LTKSKKFGREFGHLLNDRGKGFFALLNQQKTRAGFGLFRPISIFKLLSFPFKGIALTFTLELLEMQT